MHLTYLPVGETLSHPILSNGMVRHIYKPASLENKSFATPTGVYVTCLSNVSDTGPPAHSLQLSSYCALQRANCNVSDTGPSASP
ncbi:hypothetical protein Hanom_Chr01g00021511 [Helianthus anomalus]